MSMSIKQAFACLFLLILLWACGTSSQPVEQTTPTTGDWLVKFDLNGHVLPVNMSLSMDHGDVDATFINGKERILVEDVRIDGDSIEITMPLYDSEFRGTISDDSIISGSWINFIKGSDYIVPFNAHSGQHPRFQLDADGRVGNVAGRWEVDFVHKGDTTKAVGIFEQEGSLLTGTFLTETGDYRYLEGGLVDSTFALSCFDGSHAFLFTGKQNNDSIIEGEFYSGIHWFEKWSAVRNDDFELTHPDSLTFLKEGYDMIDFSLPDLKGNRVSPKDLKYKDKVVLVQIMGSWCPNCMDETALLCELYDKRNEDGLEIIALAFEKHHGTPKAEERVRRMIEHHGIQYDVLLAGDASKSNATAQLPFLNHVMSYPTCIFIDKDGMVRKIRTGFYGPGTGEHYEEYVKQLEAFVDEMLFEDLAVRGD